MVHESTLHVLCKLCTFLCFSWVPVSGLETIRKILGLGELSYFQTELLMCVVNGFLWCMALRNVGGCWTSSGHRLNPSWDLKNSLFAGRRVHSWTLKFTKSRIFGWNTYLKNARRIYVERTGIWQLAFNHLRQINYFIEQEPTCLLMCQNSHGTGKIAQLNAILYALFLASIVSCKGKQFRDATYRKRKFVARLQDRTVLWHYFIATH